MKNIPKIMASIAFSWFLAPPGAGITSINTNTLNQFTYQNYGTSTVGQDFSSIVFGPDGSNGRWVVGNGGDALRLNMAKAREHAALMVTKVTRGALRAATPEVQEFLLTNRLQLAADIMTSPHIWIQDGMPNCAWTLKPSDTDQTPIPIMFSYPTCRETTTNYADATLLLIHESVHHFDKGEAFSDAVALAVGAAWQSGALEWLPIAKNGAPQERFKHSAVFTGQEMIVFGGQDGDQTLNSGGIYDLRTSEWEPLTQKGAPHRYHHQAVMADDQMIVWGGFEQSDDSSINWHHNGAIYDLKAKSWRPLEAPYQKPQLNHLDEAPVQTANRAGDNLIVWGGLSTQGKPLGGIYEIPTGTWKPISKKKSPARVGAHTTVYTGDALIVWGGFKGADVYDRIVTNEGAIYDIATNQWRPISTDGAPSARYNHQAVWTGTHMIIYGGSPAQRGRGQTILHATGGIYDPKTDQWEPFTTQIATDTSGHTALWNGKEMIVLGGKSRYLGSYYSDVIAFDPQNGIWRSISSKSSPSIRWHHSAVWTGTSMLVWGGGVGYDRTYGDGSQFFP